MADPKAPELPEGWQLESDHGIAWNPGAHGAKRIAVWNGVTNALQVTCEGDWPDVPLHVLKHLLSAHGLAIITEADRKVLEFMGQAHATRLKQWSEMYSPPFAQACLAELEARKTRAK